MEIEGVSLPHHLTNRGTQTESLNEPTTIEMAPSNSGTSERASLTISTLDPTTAGDVGSSDRPSLQFNVEINSDLRQAQAGFEALNLGQTDSAALIGLISGLLRSLFQLIGFRCLVPEAHPFNCLLLFTLFFVLLGLRALIASVSYVVLGCARLVFYYDHQRFKTCKTERLWTLLLRVVSRNVIICCIFDQTPYIHVLAFRLSEPNSFLYTLFVICMANLIVMDCSLIINSVVRMCPFIGRLQKKQLIKLVEYFAATVCSSLPVLQWFGYLQNLWLSLPYILFKLAIISSLAFRVFMILKQCLHIDHLGVRPSKEELRDTTCIICYGSLSEDVVDVQTQMRCPGREVKLSCGHIYGEQCLRNWLEEQNICPLCRKPVVTPYTRYASAFLFPPYLI